MNGQRCLDPASRVAPGAVVVVDQQAPKLRTGPLAESAIVFCDRDVVVVDKPVGMLSVADEPGNKETLVDYARTLLRRMGRHGVDAKLGVVHRLDKDTSGLMVFARTAQAKRALAAQFREHTIDRVYHAIAHGAVAATRVETYLTPGSWRRNPRLAWTLSTFEGRRSDRGETLGHARQADRRARRGHAGRMPPRNRTPASDSNPPVRTRPSAGRRTRVHPRLRRLEDRRDAPDAACADARIRASANRRARVASSANRPTTSGRCLNRFDRLAVNRAAASTRCFGAAAARVRGRQPA